MSAGAGGGRGLPGKGDPWALLLEQASELNDELQRENCELKSEVTVLRQRQMEKDAARSKAGVSRAARAANLMPRVMSHVRRAMRELGEPPEVCGQGLHAAVEEAVRAALAAAGDFSCGGELPVLASSEETAALVQEKVTLKEFSVAQQERLLELELAREKLVGSAGSQGFSFSRLTSALQGSLAEAAAAASLHQSAPQCAAPAVDQQSQQPTPPTVVVGDQCEVVGKKGAIIRESEDLESPEVATLLPGSRVLILELGRVGSRRARVRPLDPVAPSADPPTGGSSSSTAVPPSGDPAQGAAPSPAPAPEAAVAEANPAQTTPPPQGDISQLPGDDPSLLGDASHAGDAAAKMVAAEDTDGPSAAEQLLGPADEDSSTGQQDPDADTSAAGPQATEEVPAAPAQEGQQDVPAASTDAAPDGTAAEGTGELVATHVIAEGAPAGGGGDGDTAGSSGAVFGGDPSEDSTAAQGGIAGSAGETAAGGSGDAVEAATRHSDAFPEGWLSVSTKTGKALIRSLVVNEVVNDDGATFALGTRDGDSHLYYCGRYFGTEVVSSPEGRCGPAGGPQCASRKHYRDQSQEAAGTGSGGAPSAVSSGTAEASGAGSFSAAPSCASTAAPPPAQASASSTSTPRATSEASAHCAEESGGARPPAVSAWSTVTVSTDAWLNLRKERNERERHIKVLQAQVDTAQRELAELARVREQLREQRQLALETRRRGNEFHEAARMCDEEMRMLELEAAELAEAEAAAETARQEAAKAAAAAREAQEAAEQERAAAAADAAAAEAAARAEAEADRARSVEWQRLLHERETTAQELGSTLKRIDELERTLEERRIDLQLVEKRREKERRSLLTALRELRGGVDAAEDADWEEEAAREEADAAAEAEPPSPKGLSAEKERRYLQKISELEEQISSLRSQLSSVQARETALNQSAQTRGAALRYATASVAAGGSDAAPEGALLAAVGGDASWGERRWQGRADLEGLTDMLDRLFVENFALRGSGQHAPSPGTTATSPAGASAPAASSPASASSVVESIAPGIDLSRFVVQEGTASDEDVDSSSDSDRGSRRPRRMPPPAPLTKAPDAFVAAASRPSAASKAGGRPASGGFGGSGGSRSSAPAGAGAPAAELAAAGTDELGAFGASALPEGTVSPAQRQAPMPTSPRSMLLSGLDFSTIGVAE